MNLPVRLIFIHIGLAASCVIRCRDPLARRFTACRLVLFCYSLEHVVRNNAALVLIND